MSIDLLTAEAILLSDPRLHEIYRQKYEISFKSVTGKQIALNRRALTSVGVWIENILDPHHVGLSSSATIEYYPSSKPRAHLSASRFTGPYTPKLGRAELATTAGTCACETKRTFEFS